MTDEDLKDLRHAERLVDRRKRRDGFIAALLGSSKFIRAPNGAGLAEILFTADQVMSAIDCQTDTGKYPASHDLVLADDATGAFVETFSQEYVVRPIRIGVHIRCDICGGTWTDLTQLAKSWCTGEPPPVTEPLVLPDRACSCRGLHPCEVCEGTG